MEEFIGQENKNIYEALTSGIHSVEWPGHCRNCDWIYSDQMKRDVVKRMLDNPMTDFLRIVSDVFKTSIPGDMKIRYCCINNFRPKIERRFSVHEDLEVDEAKKYRVFSETLVIEEGLEEWYDVSWAIDDTDLLEEARKETVAVPPPRPSSQNLFQIPSPNSCHGHGHQPTSLFDILEQISA